MVYEAGRAGKAAKLHSTSTKRNDNESLEVLRRIVNKQAGGEDLGAWGAIQRIGNDSRNQDSHMASPGAGGMSSSTTTGRSHLNGIGILAKTGSATLFSVRIMPNFRISVCPKTRPGLTESPRVGGLRRFWLRRHWVGCTCVYFVLYFFCFTFCCKKRFLKTF